jgi:diguanylate cyclase (GGDEF)-like protein
MIYDDVVGVMSVQSEDYGVYTNDHLRVLMTIGDQAAVALENARLYELATVDGLTGLFVRRYFDHRLDEEWERSHRYSNPFVVVIFDLDNFKKINDTYGHQVGDKVLRSSGKVIRNNMRSIDIAARYGGEEFAFLLPRTDLKEALAVAERIRQDISQEEVSVDSGVLTVTASIGLAGYPDSNCESASELLSQADEALYQAKRAGKNRVAVYGQ